MRLTCNARKLGLGRGQFKHRLVAHAQGKGLRLVQGHILKKPQGKARIHTQVCERAWVFNVVLATRRHVEPHKVHGAACLKAHAQHVFVRGVDEGQNLRFGAGFGNVRGKYGGIAKKPSQYKTDGRIYAKKP